MLNPFSEDLSSATTETVDIPVWPGSVSARMKVDVAVSPHGQVLVLHDQPFPSYLEWIEFDAESGEMTFVTAGGKIQGLGLTIFAPMNRHVAKAHEVCTICIRNNEIRDMGLVPMTVRNKH
ncbi:MAG: hypothetical protein HYS17_05450 [Micavibrio aeruginosavorus]|uniref:Uncharacterized protein n=1 Tax=Micavibrio aeruginosavorus TaxID=349221 RepID=A0A7T5R461_9BACT|nr:MAG: hypothetical protein HYS17_05450 [Micavibrio aeruginosavorus]